MAAEIAKTHKSTQSSTSLSKRLEELRKLNVRLFSKPDDILDQILANTDGERAVGSLREMLHTLKVVELRKELQALGVERVPQGPKAKLVDLCLQHMFPTTAAGFLANVLSLGGERVEMIKGLVRAGGVRYISMDLVKTGDEVVPPTFPVTMLFTQGSSFMEVVPKEAFEPLSSLTDMQWDMYIRKADLCAEVVRYITLAADMRGMTPLAATIREWEAANEQLLDQEIRNALVQPMSWHEQDGLPVKHEDGTVYIASIMLGLVAGEDSGLPSDDALDALIAAHKQRSPKPVPAEVLAAPSFSEYLFSLPQATDVLALLDEHVPDGMSDALFGLVITNQLVHELQMHDKWERVDEILEQEGLRAVGDLQAQLYLRCERLDRVLPKWYFNGWTLAETDEQEGRALSPLQFVEGGGSEESGFVWIDEFDEEYDEEYDGSDDADFDPNYLIKQNDAYLVEFEGWLEASGLKRNTVRRHIENLDFFLNSYLADYMHLPMERGVGMMNSFLGEFFIRKAMWSTPSTIRSNAASLKKFYKCMFEKGRVSRDDLDYLLYDIKQGLPEWCETCAEYNDTDFANPFALW